MPRALFEYDPPDRFVAGTVGEPGQRTFYLQASGGGRLTSVALEKVQVAALAERVDVILDEVLRLSAGAEAPAVAPQGLDDRAPLDTPITEDFRVGTLSLAWEPEDERLVIEAYAVIADEGTQGGTGDGTDDQETGDGTDAADPTDDADLLRVRLTAGVARAFAKRALAVVGAGRPACPFCNLPLDPTGHVCPRQNGYLRR